MYHSHALTLLREAQKMDLSPILGRPLYRDFITQVFDQNATMYDQYQDLLNGTDYVYNNNTIQYEGIKPMLCYFAYARFLPKQPLNVVRFGVTTKQTDESTPVDPKILNQNVIDARGSAIHYQEDVTCFLQSNKDIYTLYEDKLSVSTNKNSISVSKAQRVATNQFYNRDGIYTKNPYNNY